MSLKERIDFAVIDLSILLGVLLGVHVQSLYGWLSLGRRGPYWKTPHYRHGKDLGAFAGFFEERGSLLGRPSNLGR